MLIIVRAKEMTLVTQSRSNKADKKPEHKLPYDVENIMMINSDNFILKEEGKNEIRLLSVGYFGKEYYQDSLIFRTNSYDIVKFLSNKNNLFVMCQSG